MVDVARARTIADGAAGPGVWVHVDERGIAAAAADGLARAASGDWVSGTLGDRARAFAGYLCESALLQALLAGRAELRDGSVHIDPTPRTGDPERRAAAAVLYRSVWLLARDVQSEVGITTHAGPDVVDTGFPWPAAVGVAIVSVASAVAIGYVAHQAAQVVDRHLSRREDTRRLMQTDQKVLQLVRAHVEREKAAGQHVPLDDATKAALSAAKEQQDQILEKREAPLSPVVPDLSRSETLFGFSMGSLLTLGVVGAGLYLISK